VGERFAADLHEKIIRGFECGWELILPETARQRLSKILGRGGSPQTPHFCGGAAPFTFSERAARQGRRGSERESP
jgi:hypothetical protein